MNTSTPSTPSKKHRALQLRMPVFVVIVAGCALVMWAWKYNRANQNIDHATMTLHLNELSRSKNPETRRKAAIVLADTPTELAAETLEPLLIAATRDADPGVRGEAVSALSSVLTGSAWERSGAEMADQVDRALPTLVSLLDDADSSVRAQTAGVLGVTMKNLVQARAGKADAEMDLVTKALLKRLRQEPDVPVRIVILDALKDMIVSIDVSTNPRSKNRALVVTPDRNLVYPALDEAFKRDASGTVRWSMASQFHYEIFDSEDDFGGSSVSVREMLVPLLIDFHPTRDQIPPILMTTLRRKNDRRLKGTILDVIVFQLPLIATKLKLSRDQAEELWVIAVDLLRHPSVDDEFYTSRHLPYSLGPPPDSVVPALIAFLANPNIDNRDETASLLMARQPKPDAAALGQMARVLSEDTIHSLFQDNYENANILSILNVETDESPHIRRVLVAKLGEAISLTRTEDNGQSVIAEILSRFGPHAADVTPELIALFRKTPEPHWRDAFSDIFLHIGPAARAALPLLKERADSEIRLQDGRTLVMLTYLGERVTRPLLLSSFAMFAIDPQAPETRSLIVPIATLAENSDDIRYRQAARDWLLKMIELDPSVVRLLKNAPQSTTDPQARAELLRELSEIAADAKGERDAP